MSPDPARVAALFDEVVDLDPEARARILAAAGDEALRAAVERLVAHDRAAAPAFLAEPVARVADALADGAPASGAPAATLPALPDATSRIGRFFVLRRLGEGGMGVVYLGYDEVLDRRVAIKLLRATPSARAWLLREGQSLARLAHPNVVAVHEIGDHEGRMFLAMELVEGPTLRAWLAEAPRAFAEIAALFVQAGRGLAAAHAAGVVHRDFKPDNVLVGADGRARIVDFGIAGSTGEPREDSFTRAGSLVGTPAYLAPEQIRGERATAASDQWSYCVALYRAAYGAPPFPESDLPALLAAVCDDPPALPPRDTAAPAWLWPILARGLAKDPAARHPSMPALLDALARNLPRDPELDPALVVRERRILASVFVALPFVIMGVLLARGAERPVGPRGLVGFAALNVAVGAVAVAVLRRRLARNLYGRRLAALYIGFGAAMLVHRLLAARLAMTVAQTLVGDLVALASLTACAALAVDRRLALPAAWMLACGVAGAFVPEHAVPIFGAAMAGSAAMLLAVWARRA
ncbi:MAG: serine/threonine-protein kinase [Minicystis sp.]